jgi:SAM-dependent methyltransferase
VSPATGAPRMGAERFQRLYRASPDPWGYGTSAYEREKYADTLAALPARPLARALEVGCSIGVFSARLAIDFAPRALELAGERLAGAANVSLAQASFPEEIPEGQWNLVVCSEVLYYLDAPALERAVDWLAGQLRAGASVVAVSWRGEGVDEPLRGDDVHDLLAARLARWHALDGRREGYRLDRFDGDGE